MATAAEFVRFEFIQLTIHVAPSQRISNCVFVSIRNWLKVAKRKSQFVLHVEMDVIDWWTAWRNSCARNWRNLDGETIWRAIAKVCWWIHLRWSPCSSIEVIKAKQNTNITVEELVAEITPYARCTLIFVLLLADIILANVPENVKAELLQRIKKFIAENFE